MTDAGIAAFGCGVTFLAVAGAYVYARARYESGPKKIRIRSSREMRPAPVPARSR